LVITSFFYNINEVANAIVDSRRSNRSFSDETVKYFSRSGGLQVGTVD